MKILRFPLTSLSIAPLVPQKAAGNEAAAAAAATATDAANAADTPGAPGPKLNDTAQANIPRGQDGDTSVTARAGPRNVKESEAATTTTEGPDASSASTTDDEAVFTPRTTDEADASDISTPDAEPEESKNAASAGRDPPAAAEEPPAPSSAEEGPRTETTASKPKTTALDERSKNQAQISGDGTGGDESVSKEQPASAEESSELADSDKATAPNPAPEATSSTQPPSEPPAADKTALKKGITAAPSSDEIHSKRRREKRAARQAAKKKIASEGANPSDTPPEPTASQEPALNGTIPGQDSPHKCACKDSSENPILTDVFPEKSGYEEFNARPIRVGSTALDEAPPGEANPNESDKDASQEDLATGDAAADASETTSRPEEPKLSPEEQRLKTFSQISEKLPAWFLDNCVKTAEELREKELPLVVRKDEYPSGEEAPSTETDPDRYYIEPAMYEQLRDLVMPAPSTGDAAKQGWQKPDSKERLRFANDGAILRIPDSKFGLAFLDVAAEYFAREIEADVISFTIDDMKDLTEHIILQREKKPHCNCCDYIKACFGEPCAKEENSEETNDQSAGDGTTTNGDDANNAEPGGVEGAEECVKPEDANANKNDEPSSSEDKGESVDGPTEDQDPFESCMDFFRDAMEDPGVGAAPEPDNKEPEHSGEDRSVDSGAGGSDDAKVEGKPNGTVGAGPGELSEIKSEPEAVDGVEDDPFESCMQCFHEAIGEGSLDDDTEDSGTGGGDGEANKGEEKKEETGFPVDLLLATAEAKRHSKREASDECSSTTPPARPLVLVFSQLYRFVWNDTRQSILKALRDQIAKTASLAGRVIVLATDTATYSDPHPVNDAQIMEMMGKKSAQKIRCVPVKSEKQKTLFERHKEAKYERENIRSLQRDARESEWVDSKSALLVPYAEWKFADDSLAKEKLRKKSLTTTQLDLAVRAISKSLDLGSIEKAIARLDSNFKALDSYKNDEADNPWFGFSDEIRKILEDIKEDSNSKYEWEKKLLDCVVNPKKIEETWDDIELESETRDSITQMVTLTIKKPHSASYGILKKSNVKGALLYGPPGCGKTQLARVLARESNAIMIQASIAEVESKWVGETEKIIKALFNLGTKLSPSIIFIDEADALFRARSEDDKGWERSRMNQLLSETDGLRVGKKPPFMLLATNFPSQLDHAILRRVPGRVHIGLPSKESREKIFGICLRDETLDAKVKLKDLADRTDRYTGSDIRTLCIMAALACESDPKTEENEDGKRVLKKAHFEKAFKRSGPTVTRQALHDIREFARDFDPEVVDKITLPHASGPASSFYI